ncbi:MAG TPA: UDP-N-acetylmuramoyl-tripeptide--D-alanyl-D-alanine ligase, partial [Bacteroidia bacterium]|nr:UDP-N-acetylmuramoyl-tripeptide--D-alanyl-D-alanine ligase [Bacteroidia bacterium]
NKFLLLGDMFELGEFSDREHKEIIQLLIHKKFTDVVLVGEEFHKMNNGSFKSFKNTQECLNFLNERKLTDSTVLIKGSRGMKMETLQSAL